MITPQQQTTLAWMRRTRPDSAPVRAILPVFLEGSEDGPAALIMPDGSYRTARLGEIHEPPRQRRAA